MRRAGRCRTCTTTRPRSRRRAGSSPRASTPPGSCSSSRAPSDGLRRETRPARSGRLGRGPARGGRHPGRRALRIQLRRHGGRDGDAPRLRPAVFAGGGRSGRLESQRCSPGPFRFPPPRRPGPTRVSELLAEVSTVLRTTWRDVAVVGEIGRFDLRGGHGYFTLKDSSAALLGHHLRLGPEADSLPDGAGPGGRRPGLARSLRAAGQVPDQGLRDRAGRAGRPAARLRAAQGEARGRGPLRARAEAADPEAAALDRRRDVADGRGRARRPPRAVAPLRGSRDHRSTRCASRASSRRPRSSRRSGT